MNSEDHDKRPSVSLTLHIKPRTLERLKLFSHLHGVRYEDLIERMLTYHESRIDAQMREIKKAELDFLESIEVYW